jgi:cyclophilin family peptidyl-prolyl cis-trans isomerase
VAAAPAVGAAREGIVARGWADPDPRVRAAAIEAADLAGAGGALVREALDSADVALRGTAVGRLEPGRREGDRERALAAWERSSGTDWIEVRESVVGVLAEDPGADDALRRIAASDPAASVRRAATTALARRGVAAEAAPAPAPEPSPYLGGRLPEEPIVVMETSRGTLRLRCHAEAAPLHVAHFVRLVREGFYDGLIWHRVVSNFVVQGGDPRGDGWGQGDVVLRDEINRYRFVRGSVGMPKAGKDTGGCQLFVAQLPTPHLDGNYTVFAQVEEGLDVLDLLEVGDSIVRARVVE